MPTPNVNLTEIVEAVAGDGVRLHGALYPPDISLSAGSAPGAVLLLHGAGGNFYGSTLLSGLVPTFTRLGWATLVANSRGHDAVSVSATPSGMRMLGAAFEIVDECRYDVAAWTEWLRQRGYERLVIAGHSLGAVKAVYSLAAEAPPAAECLLAISPPRLSHSHFIGDPQAKPFLSEYAEAERLVAAGQGDTLMSVRFPIPYLVTAAGYVDKYGPAESYNVLKQAPRVTCPMLFTFGAIELRRGPAFQGLPEELNALAAQGGELKVVVVAGADHFYTAARAELAEQIDSYLRRREMAR